ncbi:MULTISPECIES: ABC transporter ATP-binding protein [unclassified Streptomyces]|uniref:ABC transporter ATP-binding protein n=1 Tax=unclassified Streptomyces TaxID=2593676 RepID=UPI0023667BB6|nr:MULTISPECIES: ABC transporter ATP-binding protein [unclassified Streptomyces]MDF3146508.1 ABC transporter ATP-binding protein [Streptomyces sp. T21Q-yed]WDF41780.1 ABC transporter ATP-binding protein [Streptomyces sp. T12]
MARVDAEHPDGLDTTSDETGEEARISTADLMRASAYMVRMAWRADRSRLAGIVAVQLLTAAGLAALVLVLRDMLGTAFSPGGAGGPSGDGLLLALCGLVVLTSAGGILRTVASGWQRMLTVKTDRHIMAAVLRSAARSDLARFEDPAFHDRLQQAVFASRSQPVMVVTALIGALQALLSMAAVGAAFAVMTWWLLPFTLLAVLPVLKAARDERDADYRLHGQLAEGRRAREYLEHLLAGHDAAKEIRALNLGDTLRDRWNSGYAREIASTAAMQRRHTRRKVLARLIGDVLFVAVIGGMWWTVRSGGVALPTALAALAALLMLATRVQMLGYLFNNIGASAAYVKDIRTFTRDGDGTDRGRAAALPDDSRSPASPPTRPAFSSLRADRISFTYPGSAGAALHDVSVELGAGELIAVVGANGSGKTTLAKILAGLYEPDGGCLLWNGLGESRPELRRAATAMVFQDFVRFKLPARDNIAFGRPEEPADVDAVTGAAAEAGARGVIEGLAQGYETVLSKEFSNGADLSLGQWQRLALARAFYRDSPFVILDEPTASLDPQAEADLFGRIRTLFAGRTVLVISHRFSNVRDADRIYVMESGRVIEQGTHDELTAADGTYARLFRLQAEAYQHGRRGQRRKGPADGTAAVAALP